MVERYVKNRGFFAVKLVFLIILAGLFALDLWLVVTGQTQAIDDSVLAFFVGVRESFLTLVAKAVTFCGNTWTMVGLCVFIIIIPGRMKIGLPVSMMVGVAWFAQTFFKGLIGRPRPDVSFWLVEEYTYSFPSGHANTSMVFWVALLVLLGRVLVLRRNRGAAVLLRVLLAIFAFLVGVSRMYLGVHYLSDVVGGWLLAGTLLIVFFALYDNVWPQKWRVTYKVQAWGAIPKNAEKKRVWRKPTKKRAPAGLIKFPKNSTPWKIPKK